jgi:hypothetical protein
MSDKKFLTEKDLGPIIDRLSKVEGRVDVLDAFMQSIMKQDQIAIVEAEMELTKAATGYDGRKIAGMVRRMLGSSKLYIHELADKMVNCLRIIRGDVVRS